MSSVSQKLTFQDVMAKNKDIKAKYEANQLIPTIEDAEGERLGEYEAKGLYQLFYNIADKIATQYPLTEDVILSLLNEELTVLKKDDMKHDIIRYFFHGIRIENSWYNDLYLNANERSEANSYTESFLQAYDAFTESIIDKDDVKLDIQKAKEYLYSYLDLCTFIFNSNCKDQDEMRSMRIAEKILNIGLMSPEEKDNSKDGKDSSKQKSPQELYFGIASPFTVFALLRIYSYALELAKRQHENSKTPIELDSRKHLFATYAIHSFSRFTTWHQKTFLVDYSRRNDLIICRDMDYITSIDNIKPIRLFEKIASFITNALATENNSESQNQIKVGIFGYCSVREKQKTGNNIEYEIPEIDDLIYEVFSWCEDNLKEALNRKGFILDIDYYLVSKEANSTKASDNTKIYKKDTCKEYIKLKREYEFVTDEVHYKSTVTIKEALIADFGPQKVGRIISENNLIFFLDCPWFSSENFSLLADGSFETYGKWLSCASFEENLKESFEILPYNRLNVFASLNDQLNRLAVDNIATYGRIVRVIKEYCLNWIDEQIKSYAAQGKYKTVFIYSSSIRGVELSGYSNIPLIREETYSNKKYSILRFSTRKNRIIQLLPSNKNSKIIIPMWNFIKYYDISFAYKGLKHYFSKELKSMLKAEEIGISLESTDSLEAELTSFIQRDIISILRNIVFIVSPENSCNKRRNITVTIAITETIQNICNFDFESDQFSEKQLKYITQYFKDVITNIVFNDTNGFGNQAIREAFASCLYNQGDTVDDLFFQYEYIEKMKEHHLSDYKPTVISFLDNKQSWNDANNLLKAEDKRRFKFDKYNDKRLYKKLFEQLSEFMYSPIAVNTILDSARKAGEFIQEQDSVQQKQIRSFQSVSKQQHIETVIKNILQVCEKNDYTNSNLYKNTLDIKKMRSK